MTIDLDALVDAIVSVADKIATDQDINLKEEFRNVPVPMRVVLGAITLAAADQRLTGANLAAAGGFTRGSTLRDYGDLVTAVRAAAPNFVRAQLGPDVDGPSVTDLAAQLQQRNETIADLREQLHQQQQDLDVALSYARDLHERLRHEFEAIAAERASKVRMLRPVGAAPHDPA